MNACFAKHIYPSLLKYISLLALLCLSFSCAGTRSSKVTFNNINKPVSMSSFVRGENNKSLMKGRELKPIKSFETSSTIWTILWSHVQLSSDPDFSESINNAVEKHEGDAMVDLTVTHSACFINYTYIPAIIPVIPSCIDVDVSGEIVRYKGRS